MDSEKTKARKRDYAHWYYYANRKECQRKARVRARLYYRNNRSVISSKCKERLLNDPDYRKRRHENSRRSNLKNADRIIAYNNSPRRKRLSKINRERTARQRRNKMLKHKYGITIEKYDDMFEEQKGVCKICKKPQKFRNKWGNFTTTLYVDHCHKTGRVRGLLCHNCNVSLGLFKHSVSNLRRAVLYMSH